MTNMHTRIERAGDSLVAIEFELKAIMADGRLDQDEIERLEEVAEQLLDEAVEVEEVALDIASAKQTLTLGRDKTPNRGLREREERLQMLRELRHRSCDGDRGGGGGPGNGPREKASASLGLGKGRLRR